MQLNIEVACVLLCGRCFVINRSRRLVHPRGGSKPPQTGDPRRLVLLAWTPMCWRSASKQLLCGSPGVFAAGPRFLGYYPLLYFPFGGRFIIFRQLLLWLIFNLRILYFWGHPHVPSRHLLRIRMLPLFKTMTGSFSVRQFLGVA